MERNEKNGSEDEAELSIQNRMVSRRRRKQVLSEGKDPEGIHRHIETGRNGNRINPPPVAGESIGTNERSSRLISAQQNQSKGMNRNERTHLYCQL